MTIQKLRTIQPGESFVYFTGFLDKERERNPRGEAAQIANLAYDLFIEKKVCLTQRRLGLPIRKDGAIDWHLGHGEGFEYIATGALPPKPKERW